MPLPRGVPREKRFSSTGFKKRPFAPLSISIRFFHLVHLPHNGDNGSSGLIQASDGDEPAWYPPRALCRAYRWLNICQEPLPISLSII